MGLRKNKSQNKIKQKEENTMRIMWDTAVERDQDCWGACTLAGGYSCGYSENLDNVNENSNHYQCARTFADCQEWKNIVIKKCQRAHCIPWLYRLNKIPILC